MTFLVHFRAVTDDGETLHEETIVADTEELTGLEKGFTVLGQHATMIIEFDPPLVQREAF